MIDLHIHSTYSDGNTNIIDILKQAEELKLDTISITDHENCDAYKEIENIDVKQYFSGKIITGIELKTQYNGELVIDILGYNFDPKKMSKYLEEYNKKVSREKIQEEQLKEFYKYGEKYNLKLRPIKDLVWDKKKEWASIVFYNEITSHEENRSKLPKDIWLSFENFRQKYYHIKGNMFYINMSKYYPTLEENIEMIHKAGGLAFVAHIYKYAEMKNKLEELESMIKKLDGVECYHSSFTKEQIDHLLEFCRRNKVLISGGSDYHGSHKLGVDLGIGKGDLNVPSDIINDWKIEI